MFWEPIRQNSDFWVIHLASERYQKFSSLMGQSSDFWPERGSKCHAVILLFFVLFLAPNLTRSYLTEPTNKALALGLFLELLPHTRAPTVFFVCFFTTAATIHPCLQVSHINTPWKSNYEYVPVCSLQNTAEINSQKPLFYFMQDNIF